MIMMSFTSFSVLSLWNALGVPSTKLPIDSTMFVLYVLPPLVCYYLLAVLAVTPHTRTARVVLFPLVALLALRAALSVDMSLGRGDRKFLNLGLVLFMLCAVARALDWTLAKGPLVRQLRPPNSSPSTIMDALDLASNFRGNGWEWSQYRSYIPREIRPANPITFVFCAFVSAVTHALVCGALHRAILTLLPVGVGPIPEGSTIFDETLPFLLRYLRAIVISTLSGTGIYAFMQMGYDLGTILGILVLGQDPAQWPPAFDAPWLATSTSAFWGRRWQQFLRHIFLLGGYPLSPVLGRTGIVIGTFLASALWHHIMLITLSSQAEFRWMLVGMGMMAPGILLERAYLQLTGKRVGGVVGWCWTMVWVGLWNTVIIEGYVRAGMASCASPFDSLLPVRIPVEHLARDFDALLHAIPSHKFGFFSGLNFVL